MKRNESASLKKENKKQLLVHSGVALFGTKWTQNKWKAVVTYHRVLGTTTQLIFFFCSALAANSEPLSGHINHIFNPTEDQFRSSDGPIGPRFLIGLGDSKLSAL